MPGEIPIQTRKQYSEVIDRAIAAKGYDGEVAELFRAHAWRRFQAERDERVQARVVQQQGFEQRASERGGMAGMAASGLSTARSGLLNAADAATLGHGPNLIGAFYPEVGGRIEEELDATAVGSPKSALAGQVAGVIMPGSGPARLIEGGAKAAKTATGVTRLVERTLDQSLKARFSAQLIQNAVTGAGAVTGLELARSRDDSGGIQARLADAFDAISPHTTSGKMEQGMNVAAAGVTAPFTNRIAPHLDRAVRNFERRTGSRLPIDTITDRESLQRFYDFAGKSPGGRDLANDVRRSVYKSLNDNLDEIARENGVVRSGNTPAAARAVERLTGVGAEPGVVTQVRRGKQAGVLAQRGAIDRLDQNQTLAMRQRLTDVLSDVKRKGAGPEAKQATAMIRRLIGNTNPAKGSQTGALTEMTLEQLENIRVTLSDLRYSHPLTGKQVGTADDHALGQVYAIVNEAIESASPSYKRVLKETSDLRKLEQALGADKVLERLDEDVVKNFWSSKDRRTKWKAVQQFADPADQQAIKGYLLGSFIERASSGNGAITEKSIRKLLSGSDQHGRQMMEEVFGHGAIRELVDHARIYDSFVKGIGAAEGSQTAGRAGIGLAITGGIGAATSLAHGIASGNEVQMATTLGAAGIAVMINQVLRSSMRGAIQDSMQHLSRAGGPAGITRAPAALATITGERGRPGGDQYGSQIRAR